MKPQSDHNSKCLCTSCFYKNHSKLPSVQKLLVHGSRIDRLYYGKYLPLRERKLLGKLVRTRYEYDDVRNQLIYNSNNKNEDDSEKNSRVLKIVDMIDRGETKKPYLGGTNSLSECCSCCSCNSEIRKNASKVYAHRHHVDAERTEAYLKKVTSKKYRLQRKLRSVKFKSARSDPCICTLKFRNSEKSRPSKFIHDKYERSTEITEKNHLPKEITENKYPEEKIEIGAEVPPKMVTIEPKSFKNKRCLCVSKLNKLPRKSISKLKLSRKSIEKIKRSKDIIKESIKSSATKLVNAFRIKKDSLTLFREKIKKKQIMKSWECEPEYCVPEECVPEACYEKIKRREANKMKQEQYREQQRHREWQQPREGYRYREERVSVPIHGEQKQHRHEYQYSEKHQHRGQKQYQSEHHREQHQYRREVLATDNLTKLISVTVHPKMKMSGTDMTNKKENKSKSGVVCECKPQMKSASSMTVFPKSKTKVTKLTSKMKSIKPKRSHIKEPKIENIEFYSKKPVKQAVKISSSFKFEIEFYKSKHPELANDEIVKNVQIYREKQKEKLRNKKFYTSKKERKRVLSINEEIRVHDERKKKKMLGEKSSQTLTKLNKPEKKLPFPRECDPFMCVPDECDPRSCAKILLSKSKPKSRSTESRTIKHRQKSVSSIPSSLTTSSKSKYIQSIYPSEEIKEVEKRKEEKEISSSTCKKNVLPHRNGVRIGSTFSFNMDFVKDRTSGVVNNEQSKIIYSNEQNLEREKTKKPIRKVSRSLSKRNSDQTRLTRAHKRLKRKVKRNLSKRSLVSDQMRHTFKRCFCTLKMHKKIKHNIKRSSTKGTITPTQSKEAIKHKHSTQTKELTRPCECEFDPGLKENEIKVRNLKDQVSSKETKTIYSKSKSNNTLKSISKASSRKLQTQIPSYNKIESRTLPKPIQIHESQSLSSSSQKQAVTIKSSFSFNIEFSKAKSFPEGNSNIQTYAAEQVMKKRSDKIKKQQKQYNHKEKRVRSYRQDRHKEMQVIKRNKSKHTLKSPFLLKCLCKLLNKKMSTDVETSFEHMNEPFHKKYKSTATDMKIKYRHALLSHECEPGVCIRNECNPYECLELIKKREKRNMKYRTKYSSTDSHRTKSALSGTSNSISTSKSRKLQAFVESKPAQNALVKKKTIQDITTTEVVNNSSKQAVRIGSSFSFNIDFYKERPSLIGDNQRRAQPMQQEQINYTENGGQKSKLPAQMRQKGSQYIKKHSRDKMSYAKTKESEKSIFIGPALKRCFCTLRLHKMGKGERKSVTNKTFNNSRRELVNVKQLKPTIESKNTITIDTVQKIKLSPYECEPNFCIPGECNPYKCVKRIKQRDRIRQLKESGTLTGRRKSKSISSTTSKSRMSSRKIQSKKVKNESKQNVLKENGDFKRNKSRQAVRVGSSFSFNIDFTKEQMSPKYIDLNFKNMSNINSLKKFNTVSKRTTERGIKYEKPRIHHRSSQGIQVKRDHKASNVGIMLKRCFCTLKLQKRGKHMSNLQNNKMVHHNTKDSKRIIRESKHILNKVMRAEVTHVSPVLNLHDSYICNRSVSNSYRYEDLMKNHEKGMYLQSKVQRKNFRTNVFNKFDLYDRFPCERSNSNSRAPWTDDENARSLQVTRMSSGFSTEISFSEERVLDERINKRYYIETQKPERGVQREYQIGYVHIEPFQTKKIPFDKCTYDLKMQNKSKNDHDYYDRIADITTSIYNPNQYDCGSSLCVPHQYKLNEYDHKANITSISKFNHFKEKQIKTSLSFDHGLIQDVVKVNSKFIFDVRFHKEELFYNSLRPNGNKYLSRSMKNKFDKQRRQSGVGSLMKRCFCTLKLQDNVKTGKTRSNNSIRFKNKQIFSRCECKSDVIREREQRQNKSVSNTSSKKINRFKINDVNTNFTSNTKAKHVQSDFKNNKSQNNGKNQKQTLKTKSLTIERITFNKKNLPYKSSGVYNESALGVTKKKVSHMPKPYECAPNVCVPGECDPYICEKLHEKRVKQYKSVVGIATTTRKIKTKSVSSNTTKFSTESKTKKKRSNLRETGDQSSQQLVRIGSTFSFNIDFVKQRKLSNTFENQPKKLKTNEKSHTFHKNIKEKHTSDRNAKFFNKLSNTAINKMKNKSTATINSHIKRCFCTLKFHSKKQKRKSSDVTISPSHFKKEKAIEKKQNPNTMVNNIVQYDRKLSNNQLKNVTDLSNVTSKNYNKNYFTSRFAKGDANAKEKRLTNKIHSKYYENVPNFIDRRTTTDTGILKTLEPYECVPNICIPDKCNPYKCEQLIKKRKEKNRSVIPTNTKNPKSKSVSNNTTKLRQKKRSNSKKVCRNEKKFRTQYPHRNKSYVGESRHQKPSGGFFESNNKPSMQSVRIGSTFSFNIDFIKQRHLSDTFENQPKKLKRNDMYITSPKDNREKCASYRNAKFFNKHSNTAINNMKNKSTATNNSHIKRCFCTLKFRSKKQKRKSSNVTISPNNFKKEKVIEKMQNPNTMVNNIVQHDRKLSNNLLKNVSDLLSNVSSKNYNKNYFTSNFAKGDANAKEERLTNKIHSIYYKSVPHFNDRRVITTTDTHIPRTLKPYECAPNICVPDECNPYKCEQLITKRKKKNRETVASNTRNPKCKSVSNNTTKLSQRTRCNSKKVRSNEKEFKIEFPYRINSYVGESRHEKHSGGFFESSNKPSLQSVRIGSTFSFNIDFVKERKYLGDVFIEKSKPSKGFRKKKLSCSSDQDTKGNRRSDLKRSRGIDQKQNFFRTDTNTIIKNESKSKKSTNSKKVKLDSGAKFLSSDTNKFKIRSKSKKVQSKEKQFRDEASRTTSCQCSKDSKRLPKIPSVVRISFDRFKIRNNLKKTPTIQDSSHKDINQNSIKLNSISIKRKRGQGDEVNMNNLKLQETKTTELSKTSVITSKLRKCFCTLKLKKRSNSLQLNTKSPKVYTKSKSTITKNKHKIYAICKCEKPVQSKSKITVKKQRTESFKPISNLKSTTIAETKLVNVKSVLHKKLLALSSKKSKIKQQKTSLHTKCACNNAFGNTVLHPNECEIDICVPDKCDPIVCLKRLRARKMKNVENILNIKENSKQYSKQSINPNIQKVDEQDKRIEAKPIVKKQALQTNISKIIRRICCILKFKKSIVEDNKSTTPQQNLKDIERKEVLPNMIKFSKKPNNKCFCPPTETLSFKQHLTGKYMTSEIKIQNNHDYGKPNNMKFQKKSMQIEKNIKPNVNEKDDNAMETILPYSKKIFMKHASQTKVVKELRKSIKSEDKPILNKPHLGFALCLCSPKHKNNKIKVVYSKSQITKPYVTANGNDLQKYGDVNVINKKKSKNKYFEVRSKKAVINFVKKHKCFDFLCCKKTITKDIEFPQAPLFELQLNKENMCIVNWEEVRNKIISINSREQSIINVQRGKKAKKSKSLKISYIKNKSIKPIKSDRQEEIHHEENCKCCNCSGKKKKSKFSNIESQQTTKIMLDGMPAYNKLSHGIKIIIPSPLQEEKKKKRSASRKYKNEKIGRGKNKEWETSFKTKLRKTLHERNPSNVCKCNILCECYEKDLKGKGNSNKHVFKNKLIGKVETKKQKKERLKKETKKRKQRMKGEKLLALRRNQNKKDDALRLKQRMKSHKMSLKMLRKDNDAPDSVLIAGSVLDIGKLGLSTTAGIFRSTFRAVTDPKGTYNDLKLMLRNPTLIKNSFMNSAFASTAERIKLRIGSMRATKALKDKLQQNTFTSALFFPGRKRPKRIKKKGPKVSKDCDAYFLSLRRKPFIWIYWSWPWLYPHCLNFLSFWRQVSDLILFLLAAVVWSPCIIGTELCRAVLCCFLGSV